MHNTQNITDHFSFLNYEHDTDLVDFIGQAGNLNTSLGGDFQKAFFAYPVLGRELLKFKTHIYNHRPLKKVMAAHYQVEKRCIRSLQDLNYGDLEELDVTVNDLLYWINCTPANWVPGRGGDWDLFCRAHEWINLLALATKLSHTVLIAKTGGCWEKLIDAFEPWDKASLSAPLLNFYRDVILPEICINLKQQQQRSLGPEAANIFFNNIPENIHRKLSQILLRNKGPFAILKMFEEMFYARGPHLSVIGDTETLRLLLTLPRWDPIFSLHNLPTGLCAWSITDVKGLMQEGFDLEHCIGRYAVVCCVGRAHPISIRTLGGEPVSTLLLRHDVKWHFSIIGHYSYKNGKPDEVAHLSALAIVNHLNNGHHDIDKNLLNSERQKRSAILGGEDILTRNTYPFYSPALREWKFQGRYKRLLSKKHRKMTRDSWLETVGFQEYIKNHCRASHELSTRAC